MGCGHNRLGQCNHMNWTSKLDAENNTQKKDRDNRGIDDNRSGNCGLVQHDPELLP